LRRGKPDANQAEIIKQLRDDYKIKVALTTMVGLGFPDFALGHYGENFLFECKDEGGVLRPSQVKFHKEWQGKIYTVRNIEDVIKILGLS